MKIILLKFQTNYGVLEIVCIDIGAGKCYIINIRIVKTEKFMKLRTNGIEDLHLPRWEEFPQFELYIDQVITFINEKLAVFNQQPDEPLLTPSMINNYVKNGALPAPVKKKYNREHLAKLVVICMSKRMLALSDISDAISIMLRRYEVGEGYNILCDEVEYEVLSTFSPEKFPPRTIESAETRELATIRALASAVAKLLVFDRMVGQRRRMSQLASKMFKG